jgi:hypothetical protein
MFSPGPLLLQADTRDYVLPKAGPLSSLLAIFRYTTWRRLRKTHKTTATATQDTQNDSYSRYVSSSGLFIYDKVRFSPDIPARDNVLMHYGPDRGPCSLASCFAVGGRNSSLSLFFVILNA